MQLTLGVENVWSYFCKKTACMWPKFKLSFRQVQDLLINLDESETWVTLSFFNVYKKEIKQIEL